MTCILDDSCPQDMLQSLSLLGRYACGLSGGLYDCACITKYCDATEAGSER